MRQLGRSLTIDSTAIVAAAAQYSTVGKPAWGTPVLVVGAATLIVAGIPFFIECGERQRRRLYWSGFLAGSALIAVAVSWRGWGVSLGMFATGAFIASLFAFFYDGSLLKFGDRQISYVPSKQAQHDEGEPARSLSPNTNLGPIPARNHWWLIAVGSVAIAYGIYLIGWPLQFSVFVGFAVIFAAVSGWMDASDGLPIARGQKIQFAIASVASVMMFATPLIAYLAAYFGAKKWAPPRDGKHAAPPPNAEE